MPSRPRGMVSLIANFAPADQSSTLAETAAFETARLVNVIPDAGLANG